MERQSPLKAASAGTGGAGASAGLLFSEKGELSELMCKPKLLSLKSATLDKVIAMERAAAAPTAPAAQR